MGKIFYNSEEVSDSHRLKNGLECPCCKQSVSSFNRLTTLIDGVVYHCELCGGLHTKYNDGRIVITPSSNRY